MAKERDKTPAVDRRQQIISQAASLFARKGFDATSIRDIAAASGILSGSLYHHFASKEEIFVGVHEAGMKLLIERVTAAIETATTPWDRLSAAAAAHCAALLEDGDYMVMVAPTFPETTGDLRAELVRQRDDYEAILSRLIDDLDLPAEIHRPIFRLHFLGALNWTRTWYRPGTGISPEEIGHQVVLSLRPRQTAGSVGKTRKGKARTGETVP